MMTAPKGPHEDNLISIATTLSTKGISEKMIKPGPEKDLYEIIFSAAPGLDNQPVIDAIEKVAGYKVVDWYVENRNGVPVEARSQQAAILIVVIQHITRKEV